MGHTLNVQHYISNFKQDAAPHTSQETWSTWKHIWLL